MVYRVINWFNCVSNNIDRLYILYNVYKIINRLLETYFIVWVFLQNGKKVFNQFNTSFSDVLIYMKVRFKNISSMISFNIDYPCILL